MRCPKCGLENPPTAAWCDCGFDFSTGKVDQSHTKRSTVRLREYEESQGGYFSFRKMVSPSLIKAAYVIGMIGLFITAAYFVVLAMQEADDKRKIGWGLYAFLIATVGNLFWRVLCEQAILLFSVRDILASIERRIGKMAQGKSQASFCGSCGAKQEHGGRICEECGAQL